ncbi:MAG TPA: ATP-binding cassette domain-containing protein [Candidatus Sulfotelmatobacter sp.]|nr:ATP-binding cassette domain-containing protein [Candidatus Sulfotelmatobacter sp.]
MIEIRGLRKKFGSVEAVRDVSFTANDGTVVGLLGPNGAGKTTTLRMLSGLMIPDAGTIRVDNVDVLADPVGVQKHMGFLPDSRGLYPRLTPIEHIEYFGQLHGIDGGTLRARATNLMAQLDLNGVANRRVAGFSHGERTKVALARALIHQPRNVILDEPTNGLDVMSTRSVREMIRRLRQEGCCVLFSSHIMQEVSALCDRIVVIAQGVVTADGTPAELRKLTGQDNLEDAFVALSGLEVEVTS